MTERQQQERPESRDRWNKVEKCLDGVILRVGIRQAGDAEDAKSCADEKEHDGALKFLRHAVLYASCSALTD